MANQRQIASTATYQIRVKGLLDEKWGDWFGGFVVTPQENGETFLTGKVADQAELFGILAKINDLGVTLLLVNRKEN